MVELQQKMRTIAVVSATTGLRISETLGLKWCDIDWESKQISAYLSTRRFSA